MVQVCERPRLAEHMRRLSAEEFCTLARQEAGSLYRPRSEVLRMLAVGEAWGVCTVRNLPQAALVALPLEANVSAAAALRELLGRAEARRQGWFFTPPVGDKEEALPLLLAEARERAGRRGPETPVWAALECTPEAEPLLALYIQQGLALRAMRPLNGLSPYYLFAAVPAAARPEPVWVPLADTAHLALLLSRGWAAVDSRPCARGLALGLCPA